MSGETTLQGLLLMTRSPIKFVHKLENLKETCNSDATHHGARATLLYSATTFLGVEGKATEAELLHMQHYVK